MIKKIKIIILTIMVLMIVSPTKIMANDEEIVIDFFYGVTCPHCAAEKVFLDDLQNRYPDVTINAYEVFENKDNLVLLKEKAKELGVEVNGVPFLVIGDQYFIGYSEGYTDQKIEEALLGIVNEGSMILDLPFLGKIDVKTLSLPVLTVILGVIDGFNPCAMWVLLFLISLLISVKDRKRLWVLGITFIAASAIMYYFFMAAWLNVTMYLQATIWLRIAVALVALGGGSYNLFKAIKQKGDGCEVVNDERRDKIFTKIRNFTSENSYWLAILGMIGLAITINMIELLCSAGLPVIYTQILTMNELPSISYYLYLGGYVLFFMLDDMIVFGTAVLTMKLTGISTRFAKVTHIIGAILMIVIGILLIVDPGILMFNN